MTDTRVPGEAVRALASQIFSVMGLGKPDSGDLDRIINVLRSAPFLSPQAGEAVAEMSKERLALLKKLQGMTDQSRRYTMFDGRETHIIIEALLDRAITVERAAASPHPIGDEKAELHEAWKCVGLLLANIDEWVSNGDVDPDEDGPIIEGIREDYNAAVAASEARINSAIQDGEANGA